jgi:hypothetical protein
MGVVMGWVRKEIRGKKHRSGQKIRLIALYPEVLYINVYM